MMDVQWHWTNLWFAGQAKNWPLAQYYFNETRGHIQWLIKKSPTMRSSGPDKEEVNIEGDFGGIDTSSLADVKTAIEKKDSAQFAATVQGHAGELLLVSQERRAAVSEADDPEGLDAGDPQYGPERHMAAIITGCG
jgi:hypothetical protein